MQNNVHMMERNWSWAFPCLKYFPIHTLNIWDLQFCKSFKTFLTQTTYNQCLVYLMVETLQSYGSKIFCTFRKVIQKLGKLECTESNCCLYWLLSDIFHSEKRALAMSCWHLAMASLCLARTTEVTWGHAGSLIYRLNLATHCHMGHEWACYQARQSASHLCP